MNNGNNLYGLLEEIVELEKIIRESYEHKVPQFGDAEVIKYNQVIRRLEQVTPEDLIDYHSQIKQEAVETEERENEASSWAKKELKKQILDKASTALHNPCLELEAILNNLD